MRSEETKDQAERFFDIVELGRIQSPGELTQPELRIHGTGLFDKYSCLDVVDDDDAAPLAQEKRISLPAGFAPNRHGKVLKAKLMAQRQRYTIRGGALSPREGSAAYAVIEPAVAA